MFQATFTIGVVPATAWLHRSCSESGNVGQCSGICNTRLLACFVEVLDICESPAHVAAEPADAETALAANTLLSSILSDEASKGNAAFLISQVSGGLQAS